MTTQKELLVAFSCKPRGVCLSCHARRMCGTASHLTDRVLPSVPLRQWVLSVPFELRLLLAKKPHALSAVGRIFVREVFHWPRERARMLGVPRHRSGAICFVQLNGCSLNQQAKGLWMPDFWTGNNLSHSVVSSIRTRLIEFGN